MSAIAQDIAPAHTKPDGANEARARLQALGVDRFHESRLAQLYHALDHSSSIWFARNDIEKREIRSDIVAILGKIPRVETMTSIREKAAKKAATAKKSKPSTHKAPDLSFIKDKRLRDLLLARAPHRPWCCDEFCANSPRPLEMALRKKYLQLNPPEFSSFIITDIDRPGAATAWIAAGLPPPTWITINPENSHAHLVWALTNPVWRGGENQKPARLFDAVLRAFCDVLQGDEGFARLLTKNPVSDAWTLTSESNFATYELSHLASFVKLSGTGKKKREPESIGRNCLTFDELRDWAYSAVRRYADPISFGAAVAAHAEMLNAALSRPMLPNEVMGIVRSVSQWVWKRMGVNNSCFSERQAARGRKSGEARRHGSIAEASPWVAEGVSRATWYRRRLGSAS